jgi:hypothetical protein
MDHEVDPHRSQRENFLTVFLAVAVGAGFLVFLILITGGLLFYLLLVMLGVAALGLVNYLLWGHALSQSTAGEREEEQLRSRAEDEGW